MMAAEEEKKGGPGMEDQEIDEETLKVIRVILFRFIERYEEGVT
jgi:hypothetical protein